MENLAILIREAGLDYCISPQGMVILAPSKWVADNFVEQWIDLLTQTAKVWGEISIRWGEGKRDRFRVPAALASNSSENPVEELAVSFDFNISELEFDLNEAYKSKNPVYITDLQTQSVLFANPAALAAQSKSAPQFIGESAHLLNDPDELYQRDCWLTETGGTKRLEDYEYQAFRWFLDPDTGLWRRKRMEFVSNFKVVRFLGSLCRMGMVLQAVETGAIV
ncbi:MAG: hypothetical protein LRZ84_16470 [Desertifilum sp.]|nr:hypothetical protein [Desertifilum sp.]